MSKDNLVKLSDLVRIAQEADRNPDPHRLSFVTYGPICLRCLDENEIQPTDTMPIHHLYREMRQARFQGLWRYNGGVLFDVPRDEEKDRLRRQVEDLKRENARLREQVYGPHA